MISMLYEPLPLTVGGLVFVALALGLRRHTRRASYCLLLPAAAWFFGALDEWYMSTYEPEANIRVDAVLILLLMLTTTIAGSVWTAVFAVISWSSARTDPQAPLPSGDTAQ